MPNDSSETAQRSLLHSNEQELALEYQLRFSFFLSVEEGFWSLFSSETAQRSLLHSNEQELFSALEYQLRFCFPPSVAEGSWSLFGVLCLNEKHLETFSLVLVSLYNFLFKLVY